MAPTKILLVDDDEVMLALLHDFLSQDGFEVTTASNAREALKFITSGTYEVLLSDLNLPGPGDGLTVVGAMRHANPETVTILLSALPRLGAATQAIVRHADEILLKPIDPAQLSAAIRERIKHGPESAEVESDGKRDITPESDYLLTVTHELRTPLTSIRGALGLLVDGRVGKVDEKAQRLLVMALTNADRMIRLISRQLELSRLHSGFAILQTRRSSFSVLLRQAIEEITTTADLAQVRITVPAFALPEPEIFFDTDPDMMLQVLTNLLANAIKFSPPGSEVVITSMPGPMS